MRKVNPNYFFCTIYLSIVACFLTFQGFSSYNFSFSSSILKLSIQDTIPLKKKIDTIKTTKPIQTIDTKIKNDIVGLLDFAKNYFI